MCMFTVHTHPSPSLNDCVMATRCVGTLFHQQCSLRNIHVNKLLISLQIPGACKIQEHKNRMEVVLESETAQRTDILSLK